ncbi:Tn3 family transposase [Herpetosiphon llansteffanensis]|uniref:Tn3 family transposase n=1 Tax=Herpetosiphon llansteffanensis TaxID=2094568 RepID=UPI000D7C5E8E|nr:Tn3 family transposase [Herpetosiphon llansteffanensis]
MTAIHDTAYPRLRSSHSLQELTDLYTPTHDDQTIMRRVARGSGPSLGLLVMLKTFQRLGYFVPLADVPTDIVHHIAQWMRLPVTAADLAGYDASGTCRRHRRGIRKALRVQPYGAAARHCIVQTMATAVQTKEAPADLINSAIEELIRQHYELPVFETLKRAARRVRAIIHRSFFQQVTAVLGSEAAGIMDTLFVVTPPAGRTPWDQLKDEPKSPTLKHLREWLDRLDWLRQWHQGAAVIPILPAVKIHQFAAEAKTLDAARMREMESHKRRALAVSLVITQTARTRDDIATMLIKRMQRIHRDGKAALADYRVDHEAQTDHLITTLRDVVVAYRTPGADPERFAAIDAVLNDQSDLVLAQCEAHIDHTTNSYLPFLWQFYRSHRAALFRVLRTLTFTATTEAKGMISAMHFLLANEHRTGEWLLAAEPEVLHGRGMTRTPTVDLSWVSEGWWRLLTDDRPRPAMPVRIRRRPFEVCVFSQLMHDLKAGDIAVVGGGVFADYRDQLISDAEYQRDVAAYGAMVGFPVDGHGFVAHLKTKLTTMAMTTDASFPENQAVSLVDGEPLITKPSARSVPPDLAALESQWETLLPGVNLLDLLADTDHWLNWTRCFGPISGHEGKLADARHRYLLATLCYGCHIGPSQLARAVGDIDRRQIAWVNLRHISEDALDRATRIVINGYNRFALPKHWGDGRSVSADGTKWDLYEQNLLAEYHIRYGGYGGIGYYHVSDTYIALFSHFIPCGVYEAVYILDELLRNPSDIQPDTVHADTHGQSEAVFGLASLLGIRLMPRIRQWKHLTFYRPDRSATYQHIDPLFTDTIDWNLIATHLPDMLRVVLSIKAGRLNPSTILRKLSTYSQKNKLYQALRELGRVIRTLFLLEYMSDEELRITINAAMNKSESFNNFAQWLAFGGDGTIHEQDRDDQRKIIKYNHLVANCVIFYNVFTMSHIFRDLEAQGIAISNAVLAALSPYLTLHINRLGRYERDRNRRPVPLDYMIFDRAVTPGTPPTPSVTR